MKKILENFLPALPSTFRPCACYQGPAVGCPGMSVCSVHVTDPWVARSLESWSLSPLWSFQNSRGYINMCKVSVKCYQITLHEIQGTGVSTEVQLLCVAPLRLLVLKPAKPSMRGSFLTVQNQHSSSHILPLLFAAGIGTIQGLRMFCWPLAAISAALGHWHLVLDYSKLCLGVGPVSPSHPPKQQQQQQTLCFELLDEKQGLEIMFPDYRACKAVENQVLCFRTGKQNWSFSVAEEKHPHLLLQGSHLASNWETWAARLEKAPESRLRARTIREPEEEKCSIVEQRCMDKIISNSLESAHLILLWLMSSVVFLL